MRAAPPEVFRITTFRNFTGKISRLNERLVKIELSDLPHMLIEPRVVVRNFVGSMDEDECFHILSLRRRTPSSRCPGVLGSGEGGCNERSRKVLTDLFIYMLSYIYEKLYI